MKKKGFEGEIDQEWRVDRQNGLQMKMTDNISLDAWAESGI